MGKAQTAFDRRAEVFDTTIGWRFVNRVLQQRYGIDSMPETAENVAVEFKVARADQDAFAARSQERALAAQANGTLAQEIVGVYEQTVREGNPAVVHRGRVLMPQDYRIAQLLLEKAASFGLLAGDGSWAGDPT